MSNPHFDEGIVVWRDEYSGRYRRPPSGYSEQFDLQWKLALEDSEYSANPGASIDDAYIEDRIYEWTGRHPQGGGFHDPSAGSRVLDHPIDVGLIRDKDCIDIGCGMGRWTKTMLVLGARSVLSVDVSASAIESVRRVNPDVLRASVMDLPGEHPELVGKFDFACLWGVAMATHDPIKAFLNAASTVRPGGAMYLMVYAPEGIHGEPIVTLQRARFHGLRTIQERLSYVDHVYHRKWDPSYPLVENLKNIARNLLRRDKGGKIGVLDMLETYYNWVIPLETIHGWMEKAGFREIILLNDFERRKCAYHVLGIKP